VRFWIEQPVTNYPDNQQTDRDQAKGVAVKKATFATARHGKIVKALNG